MTVQLGETKYSMMLFETFSDTFLVETSIKRGKKEPFHYQKIQTMSTERKKYEIAHNVTLSQSFSVYKRKQREKIVFFNM